MPDCPQSTPTTPRPDSPRGRRRRRSPVSDVQTAIMGAAGDRRRLDQRLDDIARDLAQPNGDFDMLAELRSTLDTVRSDLLADAVGTLTAAGTAQETDIRCRFTERHDLLAASEVSAMGGNYSTVAPRTVPLMNDLPAEDRGCAVVYEAVP